MVAAWIILSVSVVLITIYFNSNPKRNPKRLPPPPGPFPWPIVGNILSFADSPHLAFTRYGREYGPIFMLKMGLHNGVVIEGAKTIREAFNEPAFSGKPVREASDFLSGTKEGILQAEGQTWVEQRRFALRNLRDFGFGKRNMESLIMEEVNELVEWIRGQNGQPIELHRRFSLAVVNALWMILSGERFDHGDPKLTRIMDSMAKVNKEVLGGEGKSLLIFFYPAIAKFFPNWSGWNSILRALEDRNALFERTIQEHKNTLPEDNPRDFLDVYIKEVQRSTDPNSSFHKSIAGKALPAVMIDFFVAGSDTTSTTLTWAMLYLVLYQDAQTKLYQEIERVVGKSKLPCIEDKPNLPYTEAFIMELSRMASILPLGVNHCTTEDVEFQGYFIPKRTVVFSNLYATHHDPEVWGDPENFRPERFLSPDGKTVLKHDSLIAFSVGKRACIGEILARDQLFLFITCLVQQFTIGPEPGKPLPSSEGELTLALMPKKHSVVMKERL